MFFQAVEGEAGNKLGQQDKDLVQQKCSEALKWLDSNQTAEKDEFEYKMKELQGVCSPIMVKMHRGGAGGPGDGPTVEEAD